MTPEEFRRWGHAVVDRIADYRARIAELPVMPPTAPGDVVAALPPSPPAAGESFAEILADVDRLIVPAVMHWQHPSFFGYFPSNASLASVLGDYLSSGIGTLGLSWQSSPALTELEQVTTDWMRQMMGLAPGWSGVIQDTASTATLVAMLCARERARRATPGCRGRAYHTAHAHSSIRKDAILAGFGDDGIHVVAADAQGRMIPAALAQAMADDAAAGWAPAIVVATSGTTAITAFDPIDAIADVTAAAGAWLHVDAAMAGTAMLLPECRHLWHGVDRADSVVVNAHKWLGVVFDCTLYFVREPRALEGLMSTNPSFLQTAADPVVRNYRDWGIPLGRRFRALKLWCLIREQGVEGLQRRIRRDLENAAWLATRVEGEPGWTLAAPLTLQTVCVRHEPQGADAAAIDAHTRAWVDRINRSGDAYLTPAEVDGRWLARVSIGAELTERGAVERMWDVMRAAVRAG